MEPRRLDYVIEPEWDGRFVHDLLRRRLKLSGTLLRRVKWLEDGILLDGVRVHTRVAVHSGQVLSVRLSDPGAPREIPPVALPLDIVYEDRDMVVVNKATGMPSHPGPGHWQDSLGNALMYHWSVTDPWADFHPVHRLDKGTSGLMVAAKHPYAQEALRIALHSGAFQRSYLAVCEGVPSPLSGTIDAPIGRSEHSILARQVRSDGQRAVTHYQVVSAGENRSLVALTLDTGRTHQIRVHMAYVGHPLTGDFLYGSEDHSLIPRPALHSAALSLTHPVTGERLSFAQPLPEDMERLTFGFFPLDTGSSQV